MPMPNDSREYSIWISTIPYASASSGFNDSAFMFVGTSKSFPYNISYNNSLMGVYGLGTAGAVFVDGIGGAVGNIQIKAVRVQNPALDNSTPHKYSNKKFIEMLKQMRETKQLASSAYVLRVYNPTTAPVYLNVASITPCTNDYIKGPKTYVEFYVFLSEANLSISLNSPNTLDVSLTLLQRNKYRGLSDTASQTIILRRNGGTKGAVSVPVKQNAKLPAFVAHVWASHTLLGYYNDKNGGTLIISSAGDLVGSEYTNTGTKEWNGKRIPILYARWS